MVSHAASTSHDPDAPPRRELVPVGESTDRVEGYGPGHRRGRPFGRRWESPTIVQYNQSPAPGKRVVCTGGPSSNSSPARCFRQVLFRSSPVSGSRSEPEILALERAQPLFLLSLGHPRSPGKRRRTISAKTAGGFVRRKSLKFLRRNRLGFGRAATGLGSVGATDLGSVGATVLGFGRRNRFGFGRRGNVSVERGFFTMGIVKEPAGARRHSREGSLRPIAPFTCSSEKTVFRARHDRVLDLLRGYPRSGFFAPEGRQSIARGVSPWNEIRSLCLSTQAPEGRQKSIPNRGFCRPSGARWTLKWCLSPIQGLTPLATNVRPSGASRMASERRGKK